MEAAHGCSTRRHGYVTRSFSSVLLLDIWRMVCVCAHNRVVQCRTDDVCFVRTVSAAVNRR